MRYLAAAAAASAALAGPALAAPQDAGAATPAACPGVCGRDEQIQTGCGGQAACMCAQQDFFAAWRDCRACLRRENQLSEAGHARALEAIASVSATFCAPAAATATHDFQSLWSDVAGRLSVYAEDSAAEDSAAEDSAAAATGAPRASGAAVRPTSAAVPGAGATAAAVAPARVGGSGASAAASGSASATTARARVGPGSASPSGAVSASRGRNSTMPVVSGNSAYAGKAISGMAVAAAGAVVVLAL